MHATLADFTTRVLTRHGALVEPDRDEIVAVMPPALAAVLDVAEYQRFAFDPRAAARHGLVVDYESPLVDRFERLVERLGRIACVRAPRLPLKPVDPEEVITRAITLTNGIFRDCRAESGDAQYVGFLVQFELLADERISGMTEIWVNTTTGSVPRLQGLTARLLSSRQEAADTIAEVAAFDDVHGIVADAWAAERRSRGPRPRTDCRTPSQACAAGGNGTSHSWESITRRSIKESACERVVLVQWRRKMQPP